MWSHAIELAGRVWAMVASHPRVCSTQYFPLLRNGPCSRRRLTKVNEWATGPRRCCAASKTTWHAHREFPTLHQVVNCLVYFYLPTVISVCSTLPIYQTAYLLSEMQKHWVRPGQLLGSSLAYVSFLHGSRFEFTKIASIPDREGGCCCCCCCGCCSQEGVLPGAAQFSPP